MNESEDDKRTNLTGVGRWIAVASELPCSVIVLLFVGQLLGSLWFGQTGATWGALLGALAGFFFGVYSVYITVQYYDLLERGEAKRKVWLPPEDELFEEYDFEVEDES